MRWKEVVLYLLLASLFLHSCSLPIPVQPLVNEDSTTGCAFKDYDSAVPDAFPPSSKSALPCDETLLSLKKVSQLQLPKRKLHGAFNVADLMLARIGNFKDRKFWNDEKKVQQLLKKNVCQNHFLELFSQWDLPEYHHVYKRDRKTVMCNWPSELGSHSTNKGVVSKYTVTKRGAVSIEKQTGKIIQVGTGLCKKHGTDVDNMIKKTFPNFDDSSNESECNDETYVAEEDDEIEASGSSKYEETKEIVAELTKKLGYCKVVTRKTDYDTLASLTKERKLRDAKKIFLEIAGVMAPKKAENFMEETCNLLTGISRNQDLLHVVCTQAAAEYGKAGGDKLHRMFAIASVVNVVSYPELRKYIPNLTYYMYKEATEHARETDIPPIEKRRYSGRYDKEEIMKFVGFLTSPTCLISLPYGKKTVKLSDNTEIDIPLTIRIQRHSEIIKMYIAKRKEEDENYKPLARSTFYEICHHCYAVRSKALTCVDYFLATGYEAFDYLESTLNFWRDQGIMDGLDSEILKKRLHDGRLYLNTDFNIVLQEHSPILSHCLTYALSDAKSKKFQKKCDAVPGHTVLCERCEQLNSTLHEVKAFAVLQHQQCKDDPDCSDNEADDRAVREILVRDAVFDINEMKRHIVRSRFSELQRKEIVAELDDTFALVTMDWAQKLLPTKKYESQRDYFGKKGMSYHITSVLTKRENAYVEHAYVHIINEAPQDGATVAAILVDVLLNISKCGITKVVLRSDNAGCYHNRDLLLSLDKISDETGVTIKRWAFSEPQAGKSSCDRKAAQVKNRVRDFVDKGNKVYDSKQFFDALLDTEALSFSTLSISRLQTKFIDTSKEKSIYGISSYYDFVPESNGVRAYKFFGIGEGRLYEYNEYKVPQQLPNLMHDYLYTPMDDGECGTTYWRSSKMLLKRKKSSTDKKNVFFCPVETCNAKFDSNGALEAHMLADIHEDRKLEQETRSDFVVLQFLKAVEGHSNVDAAIEKRIHENIISDNQLTNLKALPQGWGQKCTRDNPKFTPDSRAFLTQLFKDGELQKHKYTGPEALNAMRAARTPTGQRRFRAHELLRAEQITSFFSRVSASNKKTAAGEPKRKRPRISSEVIDPTDETEIETPMTDEQLISTRRDELRQLQAKEINEMIENVRTELFE